MVPTELTAALALSSLPERPGLPQDLLLLFPSLLHTQNPALSPRPPPQCPGKVGLPGCSVLPEGLSPFSRLGALSFRKAVGVVGPMTPALCSV